jgi:hypothetical protein
MCDGSPQILFDSRETLLKSRVLADIVAPPFEAIVKSPIERIIEKLGMPTLIDALSRPPTRPTP